MLVMDNKWVCNTRDTLMKLYVYVDTTMITMAYMIIQICTVEVLHFEGCVLRSGFLFWDYVETSIDKSCSAFRADSDIFAPRTQSLARRQIPARRSCIPNLRLQSQSLIWKSSPKTNDRCTPSKTRQWKHYLTQRTSNSRPPSTRTPSVTTLL